MKDLNFKDAVIVAACGLIPLVLVYLVAPFWLSAIVGIGAATAAYIKLNSIKKVLGIAQATANKVEEKAETVTGKKDGD